MPFSCIRIFQTTEATEEVRLEDRDVPQAHRWVQIVTIFCRYQLQHPTAAPKLHRFICSFVNSFNRLMTQGANKLER